MAIPSERTASDTVAATGSKFCTTAPSPAALVLAAAAGAAAAAAALVPEVTINSNSWRGLFVFLTWVTFELSIALKVEGKNQGVFFFQIQKVERSNFRRRGRSNNNSGCGH